MPQSQSGAQNRYKSAWPAYDGAAVFEVCQLWLMRARGRQGLRGLFIYSSVVSTMSLVTMYGSRLEAGRRSCVTQRTLCQVVLRRPSELELDAMSRKFDGVLVVHE